MKKVVKTTAALMLGLTLLVSCGGEAWPEDKVKSFKEECVKQIGSAAGDNAEGTCDCVVEKMKEKYESYADADKNVDENWMAEQLLACMKESMGGGAEE